MKLSLEEMQAWTRLHNAMCCTPMPGTRKRDRRFRLMCTSVAAEEGRKTPCSVCGGPCWKYPDPTYWLEYPPCQYLLVDQRPCCSEACARNYFLRGQAAISPRVQQLTMELTA